MTDSGHSLLGPSFYWASFNDIAGFNYGDDGHLVLGGQRPPFSMAGAAGEKWPRPGERRPVEQLGLPRIITTPQQGGGNYVAQRPARIIRHTTIHARPALVLVAPPYPDGGFMGGHIIILWNQGEHGYLLSFHYNGRNGRAFSFLTRVSAALAIARTFVPLSR